jgi:hypothetical protein
MLANSTPSQWVYSQTSAKGSFDENLSSEPYFLVASSKTNVYVQNVTLTSTQPNQELGSPPWKTLNFLFTILAVIGAVGVVLVALGVRMLAHRT